MMLFVTLRWKPSPESGWVVAGDEKGTVAAAQRGGSCLGPIPVCELTALRATHCSHNIIVNGAFKKWLPCVPNGYSLADFQHERFCPHEYTALQVTFHCEEWTASVPKMSRQDSLLTKENSVFRFNRLWAAVDCFRDGFCVITSERSVSSARGKTRDGETSRYVHCFVGLGLVNPRVSLRDLTGK